MRDKDDESRIKVYMEAKMRHIKMYNECMKLADGLDVEQFAELVRADEREACAKVCEEWGAWNNIAQDCAAAIRARGDAIDISQERVDETAKREHEWVGLTDEEVSDYWVAAFNENGLYVQTFASLIEAKLKEKNT